VEVGERAISLVEEPKSVLEENVTVQLVDATRTETHKDVELNLLARELVASSILAAYKKCTDLRANVDERESAKSLQALKGLSASADTGSASESDDRWVTDKSDKDDVTLKNITEPINASSPKRFHDLSDTCAGQVLAVESDESTKVSDTSDVAGKTECLLSSEVCETQDEKTLFGRNITSVSSQLQSDAALTWYGQEGATETVVCRIFVDGNAKENSEEDVGSCDSSDTVEYDINEERRSEQNLEDGGECFALFFVFMVTVLPRDLK